MSGPEPEGGRDRILIVRTSALGDVVHALPVLTALRRQLPGATLSWVIEEAMAPLLAGHPDLDDLIVVRLRHWGRHPLAGRTLSGIARFLDALDRFAPQVVLDLMGSHKAGVIAALTQCPRRIGPGRLQRREPSSALWITEPVATQGSHVVDQHLSLLAALGLDSQPADFGPDKLFGGPAVLDPLLSAAALDPFVLIHPGAAWANKIYPPAWWGEVAYHLHAATGLRTLVASAPSEEPLAAAVAAASRHTADLVPAPTLPHLAALLRRARLVLGGDTGPVHLAHALATPVLMLLGPTDPARNGPYRSPDRALWKQLPCSFCYQRLPETKACLLELSPTQVAHRAEMLLGMGR